MKKVFVWLVLAGCVSAGACWYAFRDSPDGAERSSYRTVEVVRADIVRNVQATGIVTPRNSSSGIPVGAQVNGKIIKLFVDYNSAVTNGQVVALIDPRVYDASYKIALAQLHVNEANVESRKAALKSAEAELVLARKTYERKKALVERKTAAQVELDEAVETLAKAEANLDSVKAGLASAMASVEQSRASTEKAKADLEYCTIVSPVDGIVIDRKVEEGETVVSSMNAVPVLTIAEDLKTVWVEATIPEADIGNIKVGQSVSFTADAYRRPFTGRVKQIRKAATTTNNVVTFPVIIEADNPGEMLFPGMTATLSIETARADDVVAVPSAAFRFRPRKEDLDRINGDIPRGRKIWFKPSDGSAPLEFLVVTEGVSDNSFTQIVVEDAEKLVGREVVTGYETKTSSEMNSDETNPFMPKRMQRNKNKGTAPEPRK